MKNKFLPLLFASLIISPISQSSWKIRLFYLGQKINFEGRCCLKSWHLNVFSCLGYWRLDVYIFMSQQQLEYKQVCEENPKIFHNLSFLKFSSIPRSFFWFGLSCLSNIFGWIQLTIFLYKHVYWAYRNSWAFTFLQYQNP